MLQRGDTNREMMYRKICPETYCAQCAEITGSLTLLLPEQFVERNYLINICQVLKNMKYRK